MFVVLCLQGVTGEDGARGERGHPGNPVKQKPLIRLFSHSVTVFVLMTESFSRSAHVLIRTSN